MGRTSLVLICLLLLYLLSSSEGGKAAKKKKQIRRFEDNLIPSIPEKLQSNAVNGKWKLITTEQVAGSEELRGTLTSLKDKSLLQQFFKEGANALGQIDDHESVPKAYRNKYFLVWTHVLDGRNVLRADMSEFAYRGPAGTPEDKIKRVAQPTGSKERKPDRKAYTRDGKIKPPKVSKPYPKVGEVKYNMEHGSDLSAENKLTMYYIPEVVNLIISNQAPNAKEYELFSGFSESHKAPTGKKQLPPHPPQPQAKPTPQKN